MNHGSSQSACTWCSSRPALPFPRDLGHVSIMLYRVMAYVIQQEVVTVILLMDTLVLAVNHDAPLVQPGLYAVARASAVQSRKAACVSKLFEYCLF